MLNSLIFAVTLTTKVLGAGDLTCNVYLHYPDNTRGELPFFWSQRDAGTYSQSRVEDLADLPRVLVKAGRGVVLVVDEPGIEPDPATPSGFKVNEAVRAQVTPNDLVNCGLNAVAWAMTKPSASMQRGIGFHGLGSGTEVVARTYLRGLKTAATWLPALKLVELASAQPAVLETLDELAAVRAPANFQVYQGLHDDAAVLADLQELEIANAAHVAAHEPWLRLEARYYNAGKDLNDAAIDDQLFAWHMTFLP